MKLQPDRIDTLSVTGYGPGWIGVSGEKVIRSVVITSHGEQVDWGCDRFSELTPAHFARLADLSVELVIFGSGSQLRFVQPAWVSLLMQRGIGMETMD
ncbi:MAG: MTH938/NDUFAF3 family protein, partial [Betaproteobacteria bacterium]